MRAADVYGVELVVLGGGVLPPDPLGHPTDTTKAWQAHPRGVRGPRPRCPAREVCARRGRAGGRGDAAARVRAPALRRPTCSGPRTGRSTRRCSRVAGTSCPFLVTSARTSPAAGERSALCPDRDALGRDARCVRAHRWTASRCARWGTTLAWTATTFRRSPDRDRRGGGRSGSQFGTRARASGEPAMATAARPRALNRVASPAINACDADTMCRVAR